MLTPKEQELIKLAHWLNDPRIALAFSVLIVWTLIWKGIALWKAAKNSQNTWFIVLLLVNTVGILEIIYIFFFSNSSFTKGEEKT